MLGATLGRIFTALPDGGRALVIGHSPTNEAAVPGLTRHVIGPMGKGEGPVADRGCRSLARSAGQLR